MLTVYALPGGGASVEVERESSLPGVGRVAAGWRKRSATLTMRRVRSFSSLARWNGIVFKDEFQLGHFFFRAKNGRYALQPAPRRPAVLFLKRLR